VRRYRHGFPAARTFDAIVLPAERHPPIIGCDQPADHANARAVIEAVLALAGEPLPA